MKEKERQNGITAFIQTEAFLLTEENAEAFFPLLPEEYQTARPAEGVVLLGAAGVDSEGIKHACGTMVLELFDEEAFLLHWLLTAPQYQRQGIGTALFQLAAEIAGELDLQILCTFCEKADAEGKEEQTGAVYPFLEKQGFALREQGGRVYRIELGGLAEETIFCSEGKKVSGFLPLQEVSDRLLTELNHTLAGHGQLLIGPISKKTALADVSLVDVDAEGIQGCVIFRRLSGNTVELAFLYTSRKGSVRMPLMLMYAEELLKKHFPPQTELIIPCVTEASHNLVSKLIPMAVVTHVSYSGRWEPDAE